VYRRQPGTAIRSKMFTAHGAIVGGVADSIGVARPGLALSLPVMREDSAWSGAKSGPAAELVACAILSAGDTPRLEGESAEHVEALAEVPGSWPPVLVHRQTMRVIDGMHRLRAAQLRGDQTIRVQFFDGDEDEAFVAAVRANVTHGLPLTLSDRRAAALRIIGSQPRHSDRWIGDVTGLAPGTVAAIRRRAGTPGSKETARLGRDGRVRPLSPAEGRLRAQEEITRNPGASLRQIGSAAGVSPATAKDVRDRLRLLSERQLMPSNQRGPSSSQQDRADLRPTGHNQRPTCEAAPKDLAWSLRQVAKDPSVRYTDTGRALMQWLNIHACEPAHMLGLIDKMPPHCAYLIANIARACARKWNDVAISLERRGPGPAGYSSDTNRSSP
jgi:ParB-like chromosome segregation protein Spo0J